MDTNRTNVIQLVPKRKSPGNTTEQEKASAPKPQVSAPAIQRSKGTRAAILAAVYTGYGITTALRYTAFFVLSILRFPIRLFCTLFVFSAMIGIPAVWIGLDPSHSLKVPSLIFMAVGMIVASAVSWLYDSLLLRLAPGQMMLTH